MCLASAAVNVTKIDSLPFAFDNGSGLGIAVKTYLDALNEESEITEELKAKVKAQEEKYGWFQQVKGGTLTKSLDTAWKLWDVVSTLYFEL